MGTWCKARKHASAHTAAHEVDAVDVDDDAFARVAVSSCMYACIPGTGTCADSLVSRCMWECWLMHVPMPTRWQDDIFGQGMLPRPRYLCLSLALLLSPVQKRTTRNNILWALTHVLTGCLANVCCCVRQIVIIALRWKALHLCIHTHTHVRMFVSLVYGSTHMYG